VKWQNRRDSSYPTTAKKAQGRNGNASVVSPKKKSNVRVFRYQSGRKRAHLSQFGVPTAHGARARLKTLANITREKEPRSLGE